MAVILRFGPNWRICLLCHNLVARDELETILHVLKRCELPLYKGCRMLIYEALEKDHVRLLQLVDELLDLEEGDHRYHFLIEEIRDLLIPHSRAEESVFYNSLRSLEIAKDTVMHSYREHMEAEGILRTLQVKDKLDADWRQTARKLKTALEHHIREEEGRVFDVARQIFTREEAEMMAEAFEKLKPEVQKEGFLKTTLDMIANVMPPRFAASLRTFNLNPRE